MGGASQGQEECESMNSGLTSHQQQVIQRQDLGLVSSQRPVKLGTDLAIPGLVVKCVIHYTTTAPRGRKRERNIS